MDTRSARSGAALFLVGVPFLFGSCSGADSGGNAGGASNLAGAPSLAGAAGSAGSTSGGFGGSSAGSAGASGAAVVGGAAGSSSGAAGSGGVAGSGGPNAGAGSGGAAGVGGFAGSGGGPIGGAGSGGVAGAAGSGGAAGASQFTLKSPDHTEGALFSDKYTCAAAGFEGSLLPELQWTAGPAGTMSYAITFIDVTLTERAMPDNNGYHWVIYNIPPNVLSLPEEFKNAMSIGATQNREYLGPCPNFFNGSETHTYEFRIYALSTATLTLNPTTGTAAVRDADAKLKANNLGMARLTGTSNASPP